jgi:DNA-binding NarL/FixJ family response regulator
MLDHGLESGRAATAAEAGVPSSNHGDEIMQSAVDRPQRPLKVFLVEDSKLVRERLFEAIASTRETEFVGCAETESEAVEKLSNLECDAIVLDINLARGNGFEVLKSVRANRVRWPQVIVFTSYAFPFYRQLTMELGANFFLDKAKDFKLLLEIIKGLPAAYDAAAN